METGKKKMDYFKDKIFDLLNDEDEIQIQDIETNDKENTFKIFLWDGNIFEVKFRQMV